MPVIERWCAGEPRRFPPRAIVCARRLQRGPIFYDRSHKQPPGPLRPGGPGAAVIALLLAGAALLLAARANYPGAYQPWQYISELGLPVGENPSVASVGLFAAATAAAALACLILTAQVAMALQGTWPRVTPWVLVCGLVSGGGMALVGLTPAGTLPHRFGTFAAFWLPLAPMIATVLLMRARGPPDRFLALGLLAAVYFAALVGALVARVGVTAGLGEAHLIPASAQKLVFGLLVVWAIAAAIAIPGDGQRVADH